MNMDFDILWKIGRSIISGVDPYSVPFSYYPPATVYFLAFLGLFPKAIAFIILTTGNLSSLLYMLVNKSIPYRSIYWLLYTPLIYALGVGQLDLLFLGCYYLTAQNGIISVVAAGLITLKPQLAFIALPWILFKWLKHDRNKFFAWISFCLLLHLFPVLLDPTIYTRWIRVISSIAESYTDTSPGLFSLARLGIPFWVLVLSSVLLIILGLFLRKEESLVIQTLASPFGYWYNLVLLVGNVPWKISVPVSIIAFILSYFLLHAFYPMILIPLSSAIWFIFKRYKEVKTSKMSDYSSI